MDIQKAEFADVIKALSDEELAIAIKLFPAELMWDELRRREEYERKLVHSMKELLKMKEEV